MLVKEKVKRCLKMRSSSGGGVSRVRGGSEGRGNIGILQRIKKY